MLCLLFSSGWGVYYFSYAMTKKKNTAFSTVYYIKYEKNYSKKLTFFRENEMDKLGLL